MGGIVHTKGEVLKCVFDWVGERRVAEVGPLLVASLLFASAPQEPPRDKLRLGVDYRWWGRNLQVRDGNGLVGAASAGPLPTGATLDVQWFPAAYFVDDRGGDLGVTLRADVAPVFDTTLGGAHFKSTAVRLRTGLMFRLPFRRVEPSVHAGLHFFESTTAAVSAEGTPRPRIPNVSYQGPRFGLGLRLLEVWRITFDVGFGATWLLGKGELGSAAFYPGATGSALDGNLGIAFRTWPWLDVRLGVDVTVHDLSLGNGLKANDALYGMSRGFVFKGAP